MSADGEDFLSRWSRRKQQAKAGEPLPPPDAPQGEPAPAAPPTPVQPVAAAPAAQPAPAAPAPPPPTLEDVASLTRDSDYSRFVQAGVDDNVKRAAMKKLFSDPHFNVMDGLDVYIDDYNKPDPLPTSMLRKMAQAEVLGLFRDEEGHDDTEAAQVPPDGAVAPDAATLKAAANEDPDLQLQPDDAARREGAGGDAVDDPGRVG
jgi:hypothetical protein